MSEKTIRVSSLHVYPLKSAAGISLSHAWLDDFGLSFDRRFVLSDHHGQFITARTVPKICLIQVHLVPTGLVLSAPGMDNLTIEYQAFNEQYQTVTVWDDNIEAQHCQEKYDHWFSQYLQMPCQLLFFGQQSQRQVKNSSNSVGFADGYPLLLISQASLDDLNQRCGENFTMASFRPNIVVENCAAFAEDTWQRIRIGDIEFELNKACSRCTFTTVNPKTAESHPQHQPLTALKSYRQVSSGDVMFGQNLIAKSQGNIQLNAEVEVLAHKPALTFVPNNESSIDPKIITKNMTKNITEINQATNNTENKSANINFNSWEKVHNGNTKDTVLEQAETAGLILPYSCREGMCGACKVQLDSGAVEQHCQDGLSDAEQQEGFILSCSCVPKSDIVISKIDRAKLRALREQEQQAQQQRLKQLQELSE